MKKKKIKIRDLWWLNLIKPLAHLVFHFKYGLHIVNKYKVKKNERVIVLSNHQTDLDPIFTRLVVPNRYLYTLSTDNVLSGHKLSRFLTNLGAVPKRKGLGDLRVILTLNEICKNNGSICIFPEGNRTYVESQYYISEKLGKWLKSTKSTIVLVNIEGGFGVSPRFANKIRKGKINISVKKVISPIEASNMNDKELTELVKTNLKVKDSGSKQLFKSNKKAEYLERLFFVCPKCSQMNKLRSEGDYITCSSCSTKIKYNENLSLSSENLDNISLISWYNKQIRFVKEMKIKEDEIIFKDQEVILHKANPYQDKIFLDQGELTLTDKEIRVNNTRFDIKNIIIASPVSGRQLVFTIGEDNYQIRGNERFNALKYVLMFNKLNTKMNELKTDKYFSLEEVR